MSQSAQKPVDPYDLHGRSLERHEAGEHALVLECIQDGVRDDVPVAFWFRDHIDPLEQRALELARGRVLDVGAGAGVHSLPLQARGLSVVALDVARGCVDVMRARGVKDARQGDFFAWDETGFDTVLCLCNGLDKVGSLDRLPEFLRRIKGALATGGQAFADSFDPPQSGKGSHQMQLSFSLDGRESAPFSVLQIDFDTLQSVANVVGLRCSVEARNGSHYLARLTHSIEPDAS